MSFLRGAETGKNPFPLLLRQGIRDTFFLRSRRWLFEILLRLSSAGGSPAEQSLRIPQDGKDEDCPSPCHAFSFLFDPLTLSSMITLYF